MGCGFSAELGDRGLEGGVPKQSHSKPPVDVQQSQSPSPEPTSPKSVLTDIAAHERPPGDGVAGTLPCRPANASGAYLRIIAITDSYIIENYPHVASAAHMAREQAAKDPKGCIVITTHSGDFLSPCTLSSLDAGQAMMEGLNMMPIDYCCFGNHEFDLGHHTLGKRIQEFKGKWLNSNIYEPAYLDHSGQPLKSYDVINVGERKVALCGLCTEDPSIYRPGTIGHADTVAEGLLKTWGQVEPLGVDAFVPLTHQLVHEDVAMCKAAAQVPSLRSKMPVVLGGHEHDMHEVEVEGISILKPGEDAHKINVVDIWWTEDGTLQSQYFMLPAKTFPVEENLHKFHREKQDMLDSMLALSLCSVPEPISSKAVRLQAEGVPTLLTTYLKQSVPAVDICMVMAGCVRGRADYPAGGFTYGNLMAEFPYDTEIAMIQLPGSVIEETIRNSRQTPGKENPAFMHHDKYTEFEPHPSLKCLTINGQPFDPEKMYNVATNHLLLMGMNKVEPMLQYVRDHGGPPQLDCCRFAKLMFMEKCVKDQWRQLLPDVSAWDANSDSDNDHIKLEKDLEDLFKTIDSSGDGYISRAEIMELYTQQSITSGQQQDQGQITALVDWLLTSIDHNKDGKIDLSELLSIVD